MAIKKIKVSNFKSFKDMEVELGKFNVLIGANASGKSNFIQFFRFLRDILTQGLDNAISMQGGIEYLRNMNIGASDNFSLEVIFDHKFGFPTRTEAKGNIRIKTYETIYKFTIKFREEGREFEIIEDKLIHKVKLVKLKKFKKGKIEEKENLGEGEIIYSVVKQKIKVDLKLPEEIGTKKYDIDKDILTPFFKKEKLPRKTLIIEHPFYIFYFVVYHFFSESFGTYNFDPKYSKKAIPITGKAELEEDGSNLAIVLKDILENKDMSRKLLNFMKDLLPFVETLDVEKFADKSLLFKLNETYTKGKYLPASLISDGTINITALILALYFNRKSLVIIEEPERNIHPYLISKVVNMMKDASKKKQIVITTHNPEILKHADLNDILLISRDKDGFSTISRPIEKEEIKKFLENEIGIEELYVQNLLGM
jgi:predicted ATPase